MGGIKTLFSESHFLWNSDMSTFISIGNAKQSFTRFFELVDRVSSLLPVPVCVQHGHTQYENVDFETIDFVDMETFSRRISEAEVVILHAGAGSVIHAIKANKKPIIIPRESQYGEHVDDHQLEFSEKLAELDKVFVARNERDLALAVTEALKLSAQNDVYPGKALGVVKEAFDSWQKKAM